jgi:hypothetical protein
MGDLSNYERGQIISARLAGASVIITATLLGVSRVTVSKVMLAYTWEDINEDEQRAKIIIDRQIIVH